MTRLTQGPEQGRYSLSGPLDFASVAELLASAPAWPPGGDIHLDLAEIGPCNSAGVALLLEWLKKVRKTGRQIKYHNVPRQLRVIARAYGVEQELPIVD